MEKQVADKSYCNAELVLYPEQMEQMIEVLKSGWVKKWAWILHDKDDGRKPHVHLMCSWGKSPTKTSVIVNRFGCRENQIEKIKGTWSDALDYLTHGNAPEKHQYEADEVKSNFDWKTVVKASKGRKRRTDERKDEIVEKICNGEIRRYNETSMITPKEYDKYYVPIQRAYKYRDSYVLSHLEELVEMKNVVWIYGMPGTGKTTFAKMLAKAAGFFYRLTSTGIHMFDEYQDEPCLIMDDLRSEDIKFVDLLGILDPYNFKSAHARYRNKPMQAEMIIVTSTKSPEQFCRSYGKDELSMEDERQLYRRIASVYELTSDSVYETEYEDDNVTRNNVSTFPNPYITLAQKQKRKDNHRLVEGIMENMIMA